MFPLIECFIYSTNAPVSQPVIKIINRPIKKHLPVNNKKSTTIKKAKPSSKKNNNEFILIVYLKITTNKKYRRQLAQSGLADCGTRCAESPRQRPAGGNTAPHVVK